MKQSLSTGSHRYINIGKPFQWGDRLVCRATEVMSQDMNAPTITARQVLLDAETGKEITGPLDLGSHVINPEPGGGYVFQKVVDEDV